MAIWDNMGMGQHQEGLHPDPIPKSRATGHGEVAAPFPFPTPGRVDGHRWTLVDQQIGSPDSTVAVTLWP
jgi:hypothetical protein